MVLTVLKYRHLFENGVKAFLLCVWYGSGNNFHIHRVIDKKPPTVSKKSIDLFT